MSRSLEMIVGLKCKVVLDPDNYYSYEDGELVPGSETSRIINDFTLQMKSDPFEVLEYDPDITLIEVRPSDEAIRKSIEDAQKRISELQDSIREMEAKL